MMRFPSLEDYTAAFKQNPSVFLTALILGLLAGFTIASLLDKRSRDIMVERHELELAQARNTMHDTADKLASGLERETALKDQIAQARTAHETDMARIAQQQNEIEKLSVAAKAPPIKASSTVPRVEVSKVIFHLPDFEKGFFFNYWISNRSGVVIKLSRALFQKPHKVFQIIY
jgi:hypothetical protein